MKIFTCSIILILFIFRSVSFSKTAGDSIFNSSQIHSVKIYFSQSHWYDSLVAYKPLDKKMLGKVIINGQTIDAVGIQFKGNSSYNNPSKKKSWKIDFNEFDTTKRYDGLKAINLNNGFKDPTFIREKIMNDFMNRNGLPAPRCTYANVFVNDTLWGFYTVVEQVNNTFLKRWFPENNGNIFKGDPNGTLQWFGSAVSSYNTKYELKTNTSTNDWSDLIHLLDKINNTPAGNFYDSMETVMHTNPAIRAWAANILFANLDSYEGSGHNYYIYHDLVNNKFGWITWDVNEAFGNFNQGMSITQVENLTIFYIPPPSANRPLTSKMLANAAYKSSFIWEVCNFIAHDFDPFVLNPVIDSLANVIRPYVYADPRKFYTNQQFETNMNTDVTGANPPFNIPGLKSFLANRRASVVSELAANGCFMGVNESSVYGLQFTVNPNPNNGEFTITGDKFPVQLQIYNSLGQIINKTTVNSKLETVNLNEAKSGIYFYRILSKDIPVSSGKLIVE
jgi:hypothetical protein